MSANLKPAALRRSRRCPPRGGCRSWCSLTCMQETGQGFASKPQDPDSEAGDNAHDSWVRYADAETKTFKLNFKLQNGRAAMVGITGCLCFRSVSAHSANTLDAPAERMLLLLVYLGYGSRRRQLYRRLALRGCADTSAGQKCPPWSAYRGPRPKCPTLTRGCTLLEAKAGPEGENAKKGLRAWRLLAEHARDHRLPQNRLPADQALMAHLVDLEACRARVKSRGSRGGQTVGLTIAEGFHFLADPCGLPIAQRAQAWFPPWPPRRLWLLSRRDMRHSGSLPLGVQCQLAGALAISAEGERVPLRGSLFPCLLLRTSCAHE
ncbi:MAG: hypothetical protein SGPRY_006520 [Prymnesium sp.]